MIEVAPQMTSAQVEAMIKPGCMVDVGPLHLGISHVQPKCAKRKLDPFDIESCSRISVFTHGLEVALLVHDFVSDCYYYPTVGFTLGQRDPVTRPPGGDPQGIIDALPQSLVYKVIDATLQRVALQLTKESGKHALHTPLLRVMTIDADAYRISVVETTKPTRGEPSRFIFEISRRSLFYAGRVNAGALQKSIVAGRRKSIDAVRVANGLEAKYGAIRA
jgi:hypothetical protein